jgi:hypothetical protein
MNAFQTSLIKRHRSTKVEVERRRLNLYDIVNSGQPMTVRQVFYQAVVRGIVEKAESGYAKVQTDLTLMRPIWPLHGLTTSTLIVYQIRGLHLCLSLRQHPTCPLISQSPTSCGATSPQLTNRGRKIARAKVPNEIG